VGNPHCAAVRRDGKGTVADDPVTGAIVSDTGLRPAGLAGLAGLADFKPTEFFAVAIEWEATRRAIRRIIDSRERRWALRNDFASTHTRLCLDHFYPAPLPRGA
jgi:hypothetical protein